MQRITFSPKKGKNNLDILIAVIFLATVFATSGCMMMGGDMAKKGNVRDVNRVKAVNSGSVVDTAIEEAVMDFSGKSFSISSLAVWQIQSQTAGLDVEMIRRKLIASLVSLNRFRIIDRQQLEGLLQEQSLSLSGTINRENAVQIGKLVGVEGFIDGYVAAEEDQFTLSLNLIETETGQIIWAKTTLKKL